MPGGLVFTAAGAQVTYGYEFFAEAGVMPATAYPGRTWQHFYQHPQQPQALPPLLPPPPPPAQAYPGLTWRRRFQHPQQTLLAQPVVVNVFVSGAASATVAALSASTEVDIVAGIARVTATALPVGPFIFAVLVSPDGLTSTDAAPYPANTDGSAPSVLAVQAAFQGLFSRGPDTGQVVGTPVNSYALNGPTGAFSGGFPVYSYSFVYSNPQLTATGQN